jgi:alpha-galactosidase
MKITRAAIVALLCVGACLAQQTKEIGIVDALAPYQSESGLVTRKELRLAEQWVASVTSEGSEKLPWVNQWLGTALPFSFKYGGERSDRLLQQWQLQKGRIERDPQSVRQEYVWSDKGTGLRVIWRLKRFVRFPAVEWLLVFENTGTRDSLLLEDIQSLDLRLNQASRDGLYTVHGARGGRSLPDDMIPFSLYPNPDPVSGESELNGDYSASSNVYLPFFNLETPETRGVLVGLGWSGDWRARFRAGGRGLRTRAGLRTSHFYLRPGERVRDARMLLLFWEGNRLHGHNMFRQLLYQCYVPQLRGRPQEPLVSVNVGYQRDFLDQANEQTVSPLIDPFIRLGAEVFIIDAGWYGSPWLEHFGEWTYSKEKYPRGFRPISERLAKANALFGLWLVPENVSKSAAIVREHPDFVREDNRFADYALRLELSGARQWFLDRLDELVKNQGLTCYRQDGRSALGEDLPDRQGISERLHFAGLYDLLDTMRERYPFLVMEGCAGGGRRIDLETVSRFHWHQKADRWGHSEEDQCSLYGANLYLPGGVINMATVAVDDYAAWSSFAGQLLLVWSPLDRDFPMDLAQRQIARYKRIRSLLSGDFYPLTRCSLEEPSVGYQFHRFDLQKGFALLFRRPNSDRRVFPTPDKYVVRLGGLKPDGNYRVHFESANRIEVLKGNILSEGMNLALPNPRSAEMIMYELVK